MLPEQKSSVVRELFARRGFQSFFDTFLQSEEGYDRAVGVNPRVGAPLGQSWFGLPRWIVQKIGLPPPSELHSGLPGRGASECFMYRYAFARDNTLQDPQRPPQKRLVRPAMLGATRPPEPNWDLFVKIEVRLQYSKRNPIAVNVREGGVGFQSGFNTLAQAIRNLEKKKVSKFVVIPVHLEVPALSIYRSQVLVWNTGRAPSTVHYFDPAGSISDLRFANSLTNSMKRFWHERLRGMEAFHFVGIRETSGWLGPSLSSGMLGWPGWRGSWRSTLGPWIKGSNNGRDMGFQAPDRWFKVRPGDRKEGYGSVWCVLYAMLRVVYPNSSNQKIVSFLSLFSGITKRHIVYRLLGWFSRQAVTHGESIGC